MQPQPQILPRNILFYISTEYRISFLVFDEILMSFFFQMRFVSILVGVSYAYDVVFFFFPFVVILRLWQNYVDLWNFFQIGCCSFTIFCLSTYRAWFMRSFSKKWYPFVSLKPILIWAALTWPLFSCILTKKLVGAPTKYCVAFAVFFLTSILKFSAPQND